MDHAVYPIEKVKAAFACALAWCPDADTAIEFAARELGITAETVREVVTPETQEAHTA